MDTFLTTSAYIFIGIMVLSTLFNPLTFGKEREPLGFWGWLLQIPFNVVLTIILLKFLKVI
jgi:hypothetical protein